MRELISCANCWFNGLQYGSIGLSVGFCVIHKVALRKADETTCAHLNRKDLMLDAATAENAAHQRRYTRGDGPQRIDDGAATNNGEWITTDLQALRRDGVGDIVVEYGRAGSTVESLAQLRRDRSLRAELALLSLGRGYVANCVRNEGRWTSGVHFTWWTVQRLARASLPEVSAADQRRQLPTAAERQIELELWSLVMLRLVFIADVGSHARQEGHPIAALSDLPERAALAMTSGPKLKSLMRWIKLEGLSAIDAALPVAEYERLGSELHVQRDLNARSGTRPPARAR